jgi:Uma2 family endonuclease
MTVAKNHSVPQPLVINVSNTDIHLSPAQLERLQSDNPDLQLELTEDGKLVVIPLEVAENRQAISVAAKENDPASNSTSKGTYNLVEMTPEETARRVAAFDRFIEYKRQLWESLTPEEKLESDRQFENLAKLLEDSRS